MGNSSCATTGNLAEWLLMKALWFRATMSLSLGASLLVKHLANSLLKLCIKAIERKSSIAAGTRNGAICFL